MANIPKELKEAVYRLEQFPEIKAVAVFGSRARKSNGTKADIDLAIVSDKKIPGKKWFEIEDIIKAASLLPMDMLEYSTADAKMRAQIKRDGKIIFLNKNWFINYAQLEDAMSQLRKYLKNTKLAKEEKRSLVIFHFIFVMELFWKLFKHLLEEFETISTKSPREAMEQAYVQNWIEDDQNWLDMMKDRNLAVHSYNEELAAELYAHIKSNFVELEKSFNIVKEKYYDNAIENII